MLALCEFTPSNATQKHHKIPYVLVTGNCIGTPTSDIAIFQYFLYCRIPHDNYTAEDPDQVYDMLMKNFKRVYEGDLDFDGEPVPGNRAPWGLYMHAAWFFGDYGWHFTGYKKFIAVCCPLFILTMTSLLLGNCNL